MPIWLILATAVSIAAAGLLAFVLYRINAPMLADGKRRRDEGGDGGPVMADGGGSRSRHDNDADNGSDGGSDGGGDGGGGD